MNSEPFVEVTGVKVLARDVLEVTFDYGEVRVVDVEDHLWGPAFDPLRDAYLLFTAVRMDEDAGTIVWPDGADLSPEGLYAKSKPAVPAGPAGHGSGTLGQRRQSEHAGSPV